MRGQMRTSSKSCARARCVGLRVCGSRSRCRLLALKPATEEASTRAREVTPGPSLPTNFEVMCASVENMPVGTKFLEAAICRLYYFNQDQQHIFQDLVKAMRGCRTALSALAVANILTIIQASQESANEAMGEASAQAMNANIIIAHSGLTIGDVAYWADSLMVAFLISYAIGPFERVMKSRSNQMAYTMQGLNRLALIFQQLSIGSVAVSTVTGLEAAAKFPPLVIGTSAVFFGVAVVRSAAMWWTLSRHASNNEEVSRTLSAIRNPEDADGRSMGILDRWATFLAFGYLLQYEQKAPQALMSLDSMGSGAISTVPTIPTTTTVIATTNGSTTTTANTNGSSSNGSSMNGGGGAAEASPAPPPPSPPAMTYEFSLVEERLLRGLTEASSTAGLALGLQAFVTLMLTVAEYGVGDLPSMVGNGINATNKAVMAAILFNACASYDRALHTAGRDDVEHLMEGLGSKGLTGLFDSLAVLSWAVTIATLAGLALPWMEENVLAKAVGEGMSHRTAEAVIEVFEYARAIMRGI